jgi:hypothetical protein
MSDAVEHRGNGRRKASYLALTASILGLFGFCTNGFTALIGVLLATLALFLRRTKRSSSEGKSLATAAMIISILALYVTAHFYIASIRVSRILKAGPFARLPESATQVRSETFHPWFSFCCMHYLTFKAQARDIETFLSESPCLKDVKVEVFSPEHMYLPFSEIDDENNRGRHTYYSPDSNPPYWDDMTIKQKGRKYDIGMTDYYEGAKVIVNDETNTVYIVLDVG